MKRRKCRYYYTYSVADGVLTLREGNKNTYTLFDYFKAIISWFSLETINLELFVANNYSKNIMDQISDYNAMR